ncbi:separase isoform X1 [Tanacetum coccineum]|uniref:separase n=1 Tax=Tanacetum coccineum TaxID=301880 RepID=A0ABQ5IRW5_9ASTR
MLTLALVDESRQDSQKALISNRMSFYKEQWETEEDVAESDLHQITFHDVLFGFEEFQKLNVLISLKVANREGTPPGERAMLFIELPRMLPWEGRPILRHQEVYRMPSIASIFYSLNVCRPVEKKVVENSEDLDNLLDGCYVGKLRESPSVDELIKALVNHDLFIYVGHGNGLQYIPAENFEQLNRCPTTILMGCASGLLALNGPYPPHGAPLYYILAGSPIVIANLWSIRSLETLKFSEALFDAWIKERSGDVEGNISSLDREDVPHIGSLVRLAREANHFKFIDAMQVCFGIPPDIRNKSLK